MLVIGLGRGLAGPRACPPLEGPITGFMWTPYLPVRDRTCLRLPVAFATQTGAPYRQAPTPKRQIAAFVNRAPYRLFRPLDSGHGLWPWALARDGVPREGKSSRGQQISGLLPLAFPADFTNPEHLRPPQSFSPQHDGPSLSLTHKAGIPYIPSQ